LFDEFQEGKIFPQGEDSVQTVVGKGKKRKALFQGSKKNYVWCAVTVPQVIITMP
jgi:hypothetical protein